MDALSNLNADLRDCWLDVRGQWQDSVARDFEARHWAQIDEAIHQFDIALQRFQELLEEAESALDPP